jgi:diguanylate cyclase (GGDEF)-like protein
VSFRSRLGLFFVLIVIVPMMAVAFLLFGLVGQSEDEMGKADIGARQTAAQQLLEVKTREARAPLTTVSKDPQLVQALLRNDTNAATKRATQLVRSLRLERIVLIKGGERVFAAGDKTAIAPAVAPLQINEKDFGSLGVSVVDAKTYAAEVRRTAGLGVVVRNGGKVLTATQTGAEAKNLPADGSVNLQGKDYRVDGFAPSAFDGQRVQVFTLGIPQASDIGGGRIRIGGILLGFLVLALVCATLVSRSLGAQLAAFLEAARKLAAGDFSAQVATVGKDEFAGLGDEFNKMSSELQRRLIELEQERERVQDSMRRLGEAVASKLDRNALLEIVVRTAVDGVAADAGRAYVLGPDRVNLQERARAGNMNGLESVVHSVETEALRSGQPRETSGEHANAMAHPLPGSSGGETVGVVSVGRTSRSFTQSERELFHYLAGQAARSMESVDRHETVTRESITDRLTGLANRRAFDDALASEVERAKRFAGTVGLVLIDLDNFKSINDTYGHPQGDLVLREVARVLRESSREIDHPARYGGEELALVLPGTDIEGAFNLAERVRERIAALRMPLLNGSGTLQVTASCGVAAVPRTPADPAALIAAADQALYEAKGSGKNKSVRAR